MNFKFDCLGPIKHGEIELGELTIFCGKNNTGKTYASYLIYGFYYYLKALTKKAVRDYDIYHIIKEKDEQFCVIDIEVLYVHLGDIKKKIESQFIDCIPKIYKTADNRFLEHLQVRFGNDNELENITREKVKKTVKEISKLVIDVTIEEELENILKLAFGTNRLNSYPMFVTEIILTYAVFSILYDFDGRTVYMLPAERNGLNMFYKELNVSRNIVLSDLMDDIGVEDIKNRLSKYPLPISEYINLLNSMGEQKNDSTDYTEFASTLEEKIVHGKFSMLDNGNIRFVLKGEMNIDFHLSSSTAKGLFGLDYLLNNHMEEGCLLIIDEPELNLHPDNQRYIARLIAQMVNAGIKIIISTHSDYIIKEINNLIILGNRFVGYETLRDTYGYDESELLNYGDTRGYVFNENTIKQVIVDQKGIEMNVFDEVINNMNESSDDIYYSYCEVEETDEEE